MATMRNFDVTPTNSTDEISIYALFKGIQNNLKKKIQFFKTRAALFLGEMRA
jgi:hypothetical protein